MSGGDVGPLGEDAVNQLHDLFQWAAKSRKGLLVFIDEAEAFLSCRSSGLEENSSLRSALNALLYQTGSPSTTFMLVLATNRPQDLDVAILDRVDVSMLIDVPAVEQRRDLLKLYLDVHVLSAQNDKKMLNGKKAVIEESCCSEKTIGDIAESIGGFSGREISKLFIAIRFALTMNAEKTLTKEIMDAIVQEKIKEHSQKESFGDQQDGRLKVMIPSSPSKSLRQGAQPVSPEQTSRERRLNELELKLSRQRIMNGENMPGIVKLNS